METGRITDGVLNTQIDRHQTATSDVLAHEFGHAFNDASNPSKVYNAMIALSANYSCQDVNNRSKVFSGTAIEWQWRYNDLYKKSKKQ